MRRFFGALISLCVFMSAVQALASMGPGMGPGTGFNPSQAAGPQGPSINPGQGGSLMMTTSQGTFAAMPYFYNIDDFKSLVDNALGMQMTMTYQADGSFMINYPGLQYGFCLRPDPEAVFASNGTDAAGLKLPPGFTEFSPFALRYTKGFSQDFRPACLSRLHPAIRQPFDFDGPS